MKNFVLSLIRFYKKYLSPGRYGVKICRFEPSCSQYTAQAIEHFGLFKGLLKGFWRIMRCNPFFKGGYDPVIKE